MAENQWRSSNRLKNDMDVVIQDLDRDTMMEIAAGVSHLNFAVGYIQGNLGALDLGASQ
jgi:hypothetical protein